MTLAELFAKFGAQNPTLVMLTVALLMCRVLPTLVFSPMLGGEVTPPEVKIGTSIVLAAVLYPAVAGRAELIPTTAIPYVALLFKELFIGLALSFIVASVFEAARVAGAIIDTQSGAAQGHVHVPQLQEDVPIFSSFKLLFAVALFLTLDGHHVVIEGFAGSLVDLPLHRFPSFEKGPFPFLELILRVFAHLMALGVILAAPAIIASLLAEISLGALNRVAPQLHVFFLAMGLKPLVATLVLIAAIHLITQRLVSEFHEMLEVFHSALRLLR
jgi:flagellar biosynthetic protein FliR